MRFFEGGNIFPKKTPEFLLILIFKMFVFDVLVLVTKGNEKTGYFCFIYVKAQENM